MKYLVTVTEVSTYQVEVGADGEDEAKEIIESCYYNDGIDMSQGDIDVTFNAICIEEEE